MHKDAKLQRIMSEFKEDIDSIIQKVRFLQVIYPWWAIMNWYWSFLFLNITYPGVSLHKKNVSDD